MANPLALQPGRSVRGLVKPTGIPRINWRDPITTGLVLYAYDTGTNVVDLVRGRPAYLIGSPAASVATQYGQVLSYTGATSYGFTQDTKTQLINLTVASAFVKTGTVTNWATPFGRTANNNISQPFGNYFFNVNPAGAGQTNIVCLYNSGGTYNTTAYLNTSAPFVLTTAAISFDAGLTYKFYLNGTQLDTATTINLQSYNTDADWIISGNSKVSVYTPYIGYIPYGAVWNRVLAPEEMTRLANDPYSFLTYPMDSIFMAAPFGAIIPPAPVSPVGWAESEW
jgi:hypothetical protein